MWKVLLACLLVAAVLVSGCVQQPHNGEQPPSDGEPVVGAEASAYDQIEQEMEQAIEDIDLEGLEDELII